jgi:hypothetical protein
MFGDNGEITQINSISDRRFDEYLYVSDEKIDSLIDWLEPICEATRIEKGIGKRRRKRSDWIRFLRSLGLVVANALMASHPEWRSVYYSRKLETYSKRGVYHPDWLRSKALVNTIDLLAECGMLQLKAGNPKIENDIARQSTFKATDELLAGLAEIGISHTDVRHDTQNAPVLVLKDTDKKLVPYDPESQENEIKCIRWFNNFIRSQTLDFQLREGEWERACGENPRPFPDLKQTALYRVFNNNNWSEGGRFYGGWWQTCPSELRSRITINDEATVELDYSGFLARALYHEEEFEYLDDPYLIPEIWEACIASGEDWETIRPSIKLMLVALINCDADDKIGGITGLKLPKGITRKKAYELIEAHHPAIAHKFRSGAGLCMMWKESSICQQTLLEGVQARIPVLPIHDSYIVQDRYAGWLRDRMEINYSNYFNLFKPIIKQKAVGIETKPPLIKSEIRIGVRKIISAL